MRHYSYFLPLFYLLIAFFFLRLVFTAMRWLLSVIVPFSLQVGLFSTFLYFLTAQESQRAEHFLTFYAQLCGTSCKNMALSTALYATP